MIITLSLILFLMAAIVSSQEPASVRIPIKYRIEIIKLGAKRECVEYKTDWNNTSIAANETPLVFQNLVDDQRVLEFIYLLNKIAGWILYYGRIKRTPVLNRDGVWIRDDIRYLDDKSDGFIPFTIFLGDDLNQRTMVAFVQDVVYDANEAIIINHCRIFAEALVTMDEVTLGICLRFPYFRILCGYIIERSGFKILEIKANWMNCINTSCVDYLNEKDIETRESITDLFFPGAESDGTPWTPTTSIQGSIQELSIGL